MPTKDETNRWMCHWQMAPSGNAKKKKKSQKVLSSLLRVYTNYKQKQHLIWLTDPRGETFLQDFDGIWSSTQNNLSVSQIYFWFDINNAFSPDTEKSSPPAAWAEGRGGRRNKSLRPGSLLAVVHSQKLSRTIENYHTPKKINKNNDISRVILYSY